MDADVVIVGAGPTGLTLANLLGSLGVSAVLVERAERGDEVQYPRAVGIDHDALRTFQAVGLIDQMLPDIIQNSAVRFFGAHGGPLVDLPSAPAGSAPGGWHRRNMFMQHLTERELARGLARYPEVEVRHGLEATAIRQTEAHVDVEVRDVVTGLTSTCRAGHVVGADGARSSVRKLMGSRLTGDTYEEPWLILEVSNDPWDRPYSAFFCDPARPIYSGHLPHNHRRWGLMLLAGESDEEVVSEAGLRRLISPLVPEFDDLDIIRAHVYRHQERVVDRMRVGRVTLVGDAAHLVPPWAGQGLNAGIRDATNLAWKLAAVHRGVAGEALMESYQSERHQHAQEVLELSRRFGKVFIPRDRRRVVARDLILRGIRRWPALASRFNSRWFTAPLNYRRGVVVRENATSSSAVGSMFIQPTVETDAGLERLDDVLGPWFSVVSFRGDAQRSVSDEAAGFWKQLDATFVRADLSRRGSWADSEPGSRVEDVEGELGRWFQTEGVDLVVVRPDRIVAAAGSFDEFEEITRALQQHLNGPSCPTLKPTRPERNHRDQ